MELVRAKIPGSVHRQERQAIPLRTKEAQAVAKARGVGLGNPNGATALRRAGRGGVALRKVVSANAERFAADLAPVLADIRSAGHLSLRAIAAELNARGMLTRRGGQWQVSNVGNLVARVGNQFRSFHFFTTIRLTTRCPFPPPNWVKLFQCTGARLPANR